MRPPSPRALCCCTSYRHTWLSTTPSSLQLPFFPSIFSRLNVAVQLKIFQETKQVPVGHRSVDRSPPVRRLDRCSFASVGIHTMPYHELEISISRYINKIRRKSTIFEVLIPLTEAAHSDEMKKVCDRSPRRPITADRDETPMDPCTQSCSHSTFRGAPPVR
jgi:hypothetical protein